MILLYNLIFFFAFKFLFYIQNQIYIKVLRLIRNIITLAIVRTTNSNNINTYDTFLNMLNAYYI